ncbi:ABC transporter substrate-binding protein [Cryobacterium sp. 10I1]|uniref:ABC transporter substrate-binding protein n=1 Tax=unclassified Cryobacterium TaxID=2649013 RepID=UPI002AC8A28F|nr:MULTISPECIES: ABC transporter substrate-binding protein [unclassified Cryobacterium]MEB0002750.1 ABC transporter substrate-binding protein [Cryobacterium sp. RTC2.1]MEB0201562.1 ABC transporter substrate-binding protein [Cryobacterium sp. 5I3]MEB0284995.1 ABC transporter substrate-binding protein [Cryobacterium sp. 10S3]MEB0307315.1 ABC transporter substrate-binding protein [Cryobacterium sp. 10I1]WPX13999.1 ABC transporter substrate-binding protein [Cryobacterium sp. 10S3]
MTAVAAVVALSLTGCAAGSTSSSSAATTLTLGVVVPASTFAAADMNFATQTAYGQAVYDTLLKADPSGEVGPDLATKWAYNADNTVLTLTLRDDVTFTDGTKFDADAAAQNIIRFRDGASANASFLKSVSAATATDPTTLTITLTEADPALLHYLTQNAGMVESPKAFTSADLQTNPIGSGPYILDTAKTVVGTSYEFTKNPTYWDPTSVHYDNLSLKVYADGTALLNAVKGGQINGAAVADSSTIPEFEAAGYTMNPFELDWTGLILFDRDGTLNPAFKDVRVRQAINYAFDSKSLLTAVGEGLGTPTSQIFPTSSVAYDESLDSRYSYDPAKAKALLAEAGYSGGLTIDMPTTSFVPAATFTLIQQQLKDVGITVNYTDAGNNFIADILAPKYAATWMQLQEDTDWALINFELTPNSTFNPTKYDDPTADALIATVHTGSKADADAAAKKLNAYIVEQAWFAPWYRVQSNFATDAKTKVVTQVGNTYPYLWNFTPVS